MMGIDKYFFRKCCVHWCWKSCLFLLLEGCKAPKHEHKGDLSLFSKVVEPCTHLIQKLHHKIALCKSSPHVFFTRGTTCLTFF